VLRRWTDHHPRLAHSQAIGAMVMGIGMALLEGTQLDYRDGRVVNANMSDYLAPVNADVPALDAKFLPGQGRTTSPTRSGSRASVSWSSSRCLRPSRTRCSTRGQAHHRPADHTRQAAVAPARPWVVKPRHPRGQPARRRGIARGGHPPAIPRRREDNLLSWAPLPLG
jgi:hypothetical protein